MPAYILYRGVNPFGFAVWGITDREDFGWGSVNSGGDWKRIRTAEMKIGSSWMTISDYPNSPMPVGEFTVLDPFMQDVSLATYQLFWQNNMTTTHAYDAGTPAIRTENATTGVQTLQRVQLLKSIVIAPSTTYRVSIEARRISGNTTASLQCHFGNAYNIDFFQPPPTRFAESPRSANMSTTYTTYTADFSSQAGETFIRPGFVIDTQQQNGAAFIRRFRFQRLT